MHVDIPKSSSKVSGLMQSLSGLNPDMPQLHVNVPQFHVDTPKLSSTPSKVVLTLSGTDTRYAMIAGEHAIITAGYARNALTIISNVSTII